MDSHLLFENINIFDVVEIDCFQNLLFSYLDHFKADTQLMKINWPWKFKKRTNKAAPHLITWELCDAVNLTKINDFYGNQGELIYFSDNENRSEILNECLKKYGAVFVCVNEYYVPYHFKHIFEKQHGLHTLLVTDINMKNGTVECVSSIPKFKGNIPLDYFEKAVSSQNVKEWYAFFRSNIFKKGSNISYNDILRAELQFDVSSSDIIYTSDVLNYLKETNGDLESLEYMCQGTWGWKITAKGNLLIDFFKNVDMFGKESDYICECIEKINYSWNKGFKLLFKYLCSKQMTFFTRAIEYIEETCEKEKKLIDCLNSMQF